MDNEILIAAVRSLVRHIAEEAGVGFEYALEELQLVCKDLAAAGDKSVNGRNLVALTVQRINKQKQQGGH